LTTHARRHSRTVMQSPRVRYFSRTLEAAGTPPADTSR
jgi:hypothetical protein